MNTVSLVCFGIFYIAMAACVGFLTGAVINLRKDLKADRQLFGVILNKTGEITNHCNKVMQLIDGTIDMLRKEHELHNQAVDAMNETMTASHEMVCSFYKLKDELEDCSSKVEKLNTRLNEFDALKYVWPATTTPYIVSDINAKTTATADEIAKTIEDTTAAVSAVWSSGTESDDGK